MQCFAVLQGDVHTRHDPHFHQPRFRNLVQRLVEVGSTPLGSMIEYSEETWDKSDGRFIDTFPYIEISRVGLRTNEYTALETPVAEAPSRARQVVRTGDILISLTRPHRGAVASVLPEHDGAVASTGFAVVRNVDARRVHREFLLMCLTASFGCDQMLMRSSGGNYPAVTRDEVSQILIPSIPLDSQSTLIKAMEAARAERKAKLAQADALLARIDDFLLDALGIAPPAEDTRRVFAVSLAQMRGQERLNSDYYHPERVQALHGLDRAADSMTVAPLIDVVDFMREQLKTPGANYLSLAHVQSHTGELTDATDTASGNCFHLSN